MAHAVAENQLGFLFAPARPKSGEAKLLVEPKEKKPRAPVACCVCSATIPAYRTAENVCIDEIRVRGVLTTVYWCSVCTEELWKQEAA
jgi:hypothetical protein